MSYQNFKNVTFMHHYYLMVRSFLHTSAGIAILGLSRFFSPNPNGTWFEVSDLELTLPHLPPQFNGYRLAHISDFHLGTWLDRTHLEEALQSVNELKPDLVVITGDLLTHSPERFSPDLSAALQQLSVPDACLAVLGNHDHWTDPQAVRQALQRAGVIDISNSVYTLYRGNSALHIAGIDDYMVAQDRLDLVLPRIPPGEAAILLAHEPDFAVYSAASGKFDLQLSGHTHGGQIRLPIIGTPFLPSFGRNYPSGLYKIDQMYLYTNRGLGTAEIQVRINCPPEITLITLHCAH